MARFAACLASFALVCAVGAHAQPPAAPPGYKPPSLTGGDFVMHDFHFDDGETLPEVRMHYSTLGTLHRDGAGHVDNAVLIMHGTTGSGDRLADAPMFASELFGPGQPLDITKYYLIFPDDLGHGKSSKPSDGLKAHFPKYDYADMVEAEHRMVTDGLHVDHLRLVMGTSMGCMHSFMWGENWPTMMDALMPLACSTVQIAGRNRVWRDMIVYAITSDPAWQGGDYKEEPREALLAAADISIIAGSAPWQMQRQLPTRDDSDAYVKRVVEADIAHDDANDELYQVNSSRDYDPSPKLGQITAPLLWINSADDFINPPELGIAEQEVKKIRHGTFVLLPISPTTHGHGTHTWAINWKDRLAQLLAETARPEPAR
ncbi:MAG TPA: alpha/beta fold hydrolase [Caulobacteraceae bacterium]